MFVCAVLVGDCNVNVNGVIHVVKREDYILPCFMMSFEGYGVGYRTRNSSALIHPIFPYLEWWGGTLLFSTLCILAGAAVSGFSLLFSLIFLSPDFSQAFCHCSRISLGSKPTHPPSAFSFGLPYVACTSLSVSR